MHEQEAVQKAIARFPARFTLRSRVATGECRIHERACFVGSDDTVWLVVESYWPDDDRWVDVCRCTPSELDAQAVAVAEPEATYRNPSTGTVWRFPKDAARYCGLVQAHNVRNHWTPPCENGHFDCALWEDGPCAAQVGTEAGLPSWVEEV